MVFLPYQNRNNKDLYQGIGFREMYLFQISEIFSEVDLIRLGDLECEEVKEKEYLKMTLRFWFQWLEIKF